MERVCLVMAFYMWIEGVVFECGRYDKEFRLEDSGVNVIFRFI